MKPIYLDYAATTPVDSRVKAVMDPYFNRIFGNPSSFHRFGQEASAAVFKARRVLADAIGADYREIIFTGSATEANNLALRGVLRGYGARGRVRPRIVISAIEHESVSETAQDLEREGADVVVVPVSKNGFVDVGKLEDALTPETVFVSVVYASNTIGTIQPIAKIAQVIRGFRNGNTSYPLFHTDAVQAFQYLDCDVNSLGVDLITLSAHKIYGPKGIGVLYVRNPKFEILNSKQIPNTKNQNPKVSNLEFRVSDFLSPLVTGGGQEQGLRSGTESVPYIVGFAKAVEIAAKMRGTEAKRARILRDKLFSGIKKIFPKAAPNGSIDKNRRLPNHLSVYLPGLKAGDLVIAFDLAGVMASAGPACSSRAPEPAPALLALGASKERALSSMRFTLGRQTTAAEIDRTLSAIRMVLLKR